MEDDAHFNQYFNLDGNEHPSPPNNPTGASGVGSGQHTHTWGGPPDPDPLRHVVAGAHFASGYNKPTSDPVPAVKPNGNTNQFLYNPQSNSSPSEEDNLRWKLPGERRVYGPGVGRVPLRGRGGPVRKPRIGIVTVRANLHA
jgi:hypothetical protein